MAELFIEYYDSDGCFTWQITGLGNVFDTRYYDSAGLTTWTFTQGGTTSIGGVKESIKADADYDEKYTPETEASYDKYSPGIQNIYAWVLVPAGTYHPAGSAELSIPYKIYLDHEGGDSNQDFIYVHLNENVPGLDDTPIKDGYRFTGYYTQKQDEQTAINVQYYNKNGECILSDKKWTNEGNITIFAYWDKLYKIYFEEEYGDDYIEVAKGEYIPDVDVPQKDGYRFLGYWTQKNGQGVQYYDEEGTPIDEMQYDGSSNHVTLYANWEKINKITFLKEGGSGGDDYVYVKIGEVVPSIKVPTRKNYSFIGYFTQPQDEDYETIVQYYDSSGVSSIVWDYDKDIVLYAHWLDGSMFTWTNQKVQGGKWNLTKEEWNGLTAFINTRRSVLGKSQYTFTLAKSKETFTASMYNEAVEAIGKGARVVRGQPISAKLMNDIVTYANSMS